MNPRTSTLTTGEKRAEGANPESQGFGSACLWKPPDGHQAFAFFLLPNQGGGKSHAAADLFHSASQDLTKISTDAFPIPHGGP